MPQSDADESKHSADEAKQVAAKLVAGLEESLRRVQAVVEQIEADAKDVSATRGAVQAQRAELETLAGATREVARGAKQHGDEVSSAKTTSEALRTSIEETSKKAVESSAQAVALLESIRAAAKGATEAGGRVEAQRVQADQSADVIATKSKHIEDGRLHVDKVRGEIDAALTQAKQALTNTEGNRDGSAKVFEAVNDLKQRAEAGKAAIDANGEAIATVRKESEENGATIKKLAEASQALEARIAQGTLKLAELQKTSDDRLKQIDKLLLGATNAGLAHAFDARSKTFKSPEKLWQWVFMGSLAGLFLLAVGEAYLIGSQPKVPDYSELLRMFLERLPFLIPLIWLAIHAARQASLSKRMEEEYAFKATISTSFEGYRRELAEISGELPESSPVVRLCNETLKTIGRPPGRVYDNHRMDPTPATSAAELVQPMVEALTKVAENVGPSALTKMKEVGK